MSKIRIWNMALGFIGTRTIASENERNMEAIQCSLFWDSARRQALRDYPWNFAQRRAWLAQLNMPEGYDKQYAYAYALPVDCLKAVRVLPQGIESFGESGRFIIVYDQAQGRNVLVCNAFEALLSYTADVEDIGLFDDLFIHMLARKLASLIVIPLLKNNTSKLKELEQLYRDSIPKTMEANASEGSEKFKPDTWVLARGIGWGAVNRGVNSAI